MAAKEVVRKLGLHFLAVTNLGLNHFLQLYAGILKDILNILCNKICDSSGTATLLLHFTTFSSHVQDV